MHPKVVAQHELERVLGQSDDPRVTLHELLRRPGVRMCALMNCLAQDPPRSCGRRACRVHTKYEGYIGRQQEEISRKIARGDRLPESRFAAYPGFVEVQQNSIIIALKPWGGRSHLGVTPAAVRCCWSH